MGNDLIVVSLGDLGIHLMDTITTQMYHSSKIKHWCLGLTSHRRTFFITDKNTVYSYVVDNFMTLTEGKKLFSMQNNGNAVFEHIAINSAGNVIYIAAGGEGLITIDSKGNYLSTLLVGLKFDVHDVCLTGRDTVYICDKKSQSILKVIDEKKLETVSKVSEPCTVCFSHLQNILVVGYFAADFISFHDVQKQ